VPWICFVPLVYLFIYLFALSAVHCTPNICACNWDPTAACECVHSDSESTVESEEEDFEEERVITRGTERGRKTLKKKKKKKKKKKEDEEKSKTSNKRARLPSAFSIRRRSAWSEKEVMQQQQQQQSCVHVTYLVVCVCVVCVMSGLHMHSKIILLCANRYETSMMLCVRDIGFRFFLLVSFSLPFFIIFVVFVMC